MSLKAELVRQIKYRKGEVFTYNELIRHCQIFGYKVENASRRLRESIGEIEPVRNKKGAIIGYRAREAQKRFF